MRVHIALFFVSLLYAILFSWAGQIMPNYLRPEAFVMLRVITATILFYLVALTQTSEKIDWKAHGKELAICGFFGTSANMYLFFHGLALTHPINGAILMLVTPLFVGIFDHIRVKAYPKPWFIVPITINKITFTFGTLYMLPIGGMALMHTDFHAFTPNVTAKVVYVLFFTSFLVYLLNSYAVKKAGPTLAGLYIYLQPVMASIIAVLLGADTLTVTKVATMTLIMGGVFLATRFSPK